MVVIIITDVLEKLFTLREAHGWSEYELAERSGISQSTISTWFRKEVYPSVPSLQKVCDTFGITLSQFFLEKGCEDLVSLSPTQKRLLEVSLKYTPEELESLINFLDVTRKNGQD